MTYSKTITVSLNKALNNRLRKEASAISKYKTKANFANAELVMKRRYAEDMALAKKLGCTIQELTK